MQKAIIGFWAGLIILLAAGFGYTYYSNKAPAARTDLLPLAQCLKDKGAIFYGAFWCPHCQNTKKEFGAAADALPYVECSTPDAQAETQVCKDAKIESFPTWVFPDGSREVGEIPLQVLADKSGCTLPASN